MIGAVLQSVAGFFQLGNLANIGMQVVNTVSALGMSIGVSRGLSYLGLPASLCNIAGSIVSGGLLGGVSGALVSGTITGVNELGAHLGWNPHLTQVLSLSAGALGSASLSPNGFIPALKTTILPHIAGELAYVGITKLGEKIGLDPQVSYLLGTAGRTFGSAGILKTLSGTGNNSPQ